MSLAAWEQALTQIEDELDAHEEAVRSGTATVVPQWEPPTDLGPLPAPLADRVTHLTSRIQLLSTFVQYQLAATESDLAHLERQNGRPKSSSAISLYLDSSV
ncbi:hypothetical protein [Mobilicoccus massiliensis]|uniref:hypothetical protein n=1 Tax=Mobilicoccus massiliensis TaxID=1522310 RepID=UPI00058EC150|nr:hypothetical protein [Mobilicoccus massiliensis]